MFVTGDQMPGRVRFVVVSRAKPVAAAGHESVMELLAAFVDAVIASAAEIFAGSKPVSVNTESPGMVSEKTPLLTGTVAVCARLVVLLV